MKIPEGTRVEVRYKGRNRYYPGRIEFANLNNTYDIAYDDGANEYNVSFDLIHILDENVKNQRIPVGTKVEARYHGWNRYYSGIVIATRDNGRHDIKYDDNEIEKWIENVEKVPSIANDIHEDSDAFLPSDLDEALDALDDEDSLSNASKKNMFLNSPGSIASTACTTSRPDHGQSEGYGH